VNRRELLSIAIAVLAITSAARFDVPLPGSPVPQSAQTLAILLVGAWLGARGGATALLVYLAAGGLGVPVFADGASGWKHLVGPTSGYLVGFVIAASMVGLMTDRGLLRTFPIAFGGMVAGHVIILGLGWARLAALLGPAGAWAGGVAPFLAGGLLKSLLAAALAALIAGRASDREGA
jgi:biotin transport system substrate-specific component